MRHYRILLLIIISTISLSLILSSPQDLLNQLSQPRPDISGGEMEEDESLCGITNELDDQRRDKREAGSSISISKDDQCGDWKQTGRVTLRLAIFADEALYRQFLHRYGGQNFTAAKLNMQEFIFSIVRQAREIFLSPTLEPKVYTRVIEYKLIRHNLRQHLHKKMQQDMPTYMDSFCRYQELLQHNKRKRWDHAVLFTGHDLVHINLQGNFAGYSSSSSICGSMSCSIIEADSFKSAYTLAHEIGHSFGMGHDFGSEDCGSVGCCVMTPTVFTGSTNWSKCSVRQFQQYLEAIPCRIYCLDDVPKIEDHNHNHNVVRLPSKLPGQIFTIVDQCAHRFGPCSRPQTGGFFDTTADLESVCSALWCTHKEGGSRLAHAAMEGTYCGNGKWCRFGNCVEPEEPLEKRAGGWSNWFSPADLPSELFDDDGCGRSECSKREIVDQLSIRREIRTCSNPSPNNGGAECPGDSYRGVVCDDEVERVSSTNTTAEPTDIESIEQILNVTLSSSSSPLRSVDEFATDLCTHRKRLADERSNDTSTFFVILSGRGFQGFDESSACSVWCEVLNSSFTSYSFFDPFPDGTPCGKPERYCFAGNCVERKRCNSTFSVLVKGSGGSECETNSSDPKSGVDRELSEMTTSSAPGASLSSSASSPSTKTIPAKFENNNETISIMNVPLIASAGAQMSKWSSWSECSRSCGIGVKRRVRQCSASSSACSNLSRTRQFQFCRSSSPAGRTGACPSASSSAAAAGGIQRPNGNQVEEEEDEDKRKHKHKNMVAFSSSSSGLSMNAGVLESRKRRHSKHDRKLGKWTEWSAWSDCDRTNAGSGGYGGCRGYQISFRKCHPPNTPCHGRRIKRRLCCSTMY